MPFTFCHPAIILPLSKSKKLSTSALILGSTAPDFEYFLRMDLVRTHSHDFWAMFYFNLPLTLALFIIFQTIVKIPLINSLPNFLFYRFNTYLTVKPNYFSIRTLFRVGLSALMGIFSHLLWDSFTHKEGLFEGQISFLLHHFYFMGKDRIVFEFLQILSSLLAGVYTVYFVLKMPTNYKNRPNNLLLWFIAIGFSFIIIYLRDCNTPQKFIATSISGGLLGLIFSALLTKIHTFYVTKQTNNT